MGPTKPERLLSALRDADPRVETVFLNGGCYGLHIALRTIWPQAVAVTDGSPHVWSEIDGQVLDIRGVARGEFERLDVRRMQPRRWSMMP